MTRRSMRFLIRLSAIAVLLVALTPAVAPGQVVVKLNDTVNFRLGMQLQNWADWTQDPNSEGYSQNFFIRRVRFILLATVAPNVTIFYQTDNPRYGSAATTGVKVINTGFLTQDAFLEWRFAGDAAAIQAGLFLVPDSHAGLISTSSYQAFDIGTWQIQGNTLMQGNGGRDFGIGLNGYLADAHFLYRVGIFDGARRGTEPQTAPLGAKAGSRNSFRYAGRWQYDFFDTEKGYVYVGTYRGTKKIVAIGGFVDTQNTYVAYGGDFTVDWPILKDAVKAEFDYIHYEGGAGKFSIPPAVPTAGKLQLPEQNDYYIDAGYYFDAFKIQPFLRYESQNFVKAVDKPKDQQRYGGGINWYVYGQNLKISGWWEHIVPKTQAATAKVKNLNHFAIQIQAFYF
jgi:hypothetical protein